ARVAKGRHNASTIVAAAPSAVVDLRALCNDPAPEIYQRSPAWMETHGDTQATSVVELAPGLTEIKYDSASMQGRQWMCRPRRDLCVMVSALTQTPVL